MAGVKKPGRKDLLVMRLAPGTAVAGVFTQNRFCAAPVVLCKKNIRNDVHALVINTGNANAGTGNDGLKRAALVCEALAAHLGCDPEEVLPFSTGVIMEPLPAERIITALPKAMLAKSDWLSAAEAIMTTDTVPKAVSRKVRLSRGDATVTGIAKGAGMIHPNMATMLGFIATDAAVPKKDLARITEHAADRSFNSITVDGDTSTNDSLMLIATGRSAADEIVDASSGAFAKFRDALTDVAQRLAQAIIRDGEGATKFITVQVEDGRSVEECRKVAFAIAHSPLVKTAFFASDPNLGRILAAIGYAGIHDLNVDRVDLYLDDVLVAQGGGRYSQYSEADGQRVMQQAEITVRVVLNRGAQQATVWTCDLSHEYVTINAEYRT